MKSIIKLTIFLGVVICAFVIFTPKVSATQYPDLSWATGASDFEIWAGATAGDNAILTWNNGTKICEATLTDTNADTVGCLSGTINPSQTYRVQVILKDAAANADALMTGGDGDFVDHIDVKAGTPENWAGASPTLVSCDFYDVQGDNTATTACTVDWSGNNVRITNTGAGSVVLIARTTTEGFMYLITTDSTVYTSSASYMSSTIDSNAQTSSKITITKTTPANAPTVSAVTLGTYPRGADNITLVEDSDIEIVVSAQVSDDDGCGDITGAKAYVFVSSAAWDYGFAGETTCSFDYNDCYTPDTDGGVIECEVDKCVGTTEYYECTASDSAQGGDGMWYHARATDATASATEAAWWWVAMVIASDSTMLDAFATSSNSAPDVVMQAAIKASASIQYGTIAPGKETQTSVEMGVENTGNRGIDLRFSVDPTPTDGSSVIASQQQQFSTTVFSMGAGTSISANGTSSVELDVALPKPQNHNTGDNDDQIFWGIAIPVGQALDVYNGTNVITTTSD